MTSTIGIVGLATMGRSLALNFMSHDLSVAVWNLEPELTSVFKSKHGNPNLVCVDTLKDLVAELERPRRILIMIKAGNPVDEVIADLLPHLEAGDILIDGGNTQFKDTRRRSAALAEQGIEFVGMGISGGEQGARHGPSLMVGCSDAAWERIKQPFSAIAAKSTAGTCAEHLGTDGAGHFVKMIHNGIEYADMQLIAEAYDFMKRGIGLDAARMSQVFEGWNEGPLNSYLIELTARVLAKIDKKTGGPLVEQILDAAEQKGTGRWTVQLAIDLGVPVPTITAAVDARSLSSIKRSRVLAASRWPARKQVPQEIPLDVVHDALYAAKLCAYAQGLQLIRSGGKAYDWKIPLDKPAKVWTGGCIIRAALLDDIIDAYTDLPDMPNLMFHPSIIEAMAHCLRSLRQLVSVAVTNGIPVPAFSASLAWFDSCRTERLPQNLTQAQRDAFGAHTYLRLDDPNGEPTHTEW